MNKRLGALAVVLCVGWSGGRALEARQVRPDNTAVNRPDRNERALTADRQPNRRSDLQTTREIRRAIVADKSLSTYAHNVKVVTAGGHVTLRGPVRTADERRAIELKAAEIAGGRNVTDRISLMRAGTRRTVRKVVR